MDPTDRIRRSIDEVYSVLRQSEALLGEFRQTVERSRTLLKESYRVLDLAKKILNPQDSVRF